MKTDADTLKRIGAEPLVVEADAQIVILEKVKKVFEGIEEQPKARLTRVMELWCLGKPLTDKMFNGNEGRSKQKNMMLQAFKAWKVRLFGIVTSISGKKTFIIVNIDSAKKQEKADKNILRIAKERVDDLDLGK
jgi:hypothetical protein